MTKINIIAQDLRQDEVSINAVHIFEYLDDAIDKVFNKIDERIARNNERIGNINQRWVEIFESLSIQDTVCAF